MFQWRKTKSFTADFAKHIDKAVTSVELIHVELCFTVFVKFFSDWSLILVQDLNFCWAPQVTASDPYTFIFIFHSYFLFLFLFLFLVGGICCFCFLSRWV
jgi:hypothetical protein